MCGKQPFRELCLDSSSGKSASKLHGIITNIGIESFSVRAPVRTIDCMKLCA
jgi:hypothetical protein